MSIKVICSRMMNIFTLLFVTVVYPSSFQALKLASGLMFSYLLPSNFASLLMLIIIFLCDLPLYFCADYFRYSNCSRAFECGKIKDITYPFWGNGRAEYCGYPDFELKCQGNSTKIRIQSQSYNVLDFNEGNQTLRIARMEGWKNNCPSQFTNISLPSNRFNFSVPSTVNLTLFYGCPLVSSLVTTNRFACSTNNSESENYFWIDRVNVNPPQDLSRCMVSVVVPVLQTLVHKFTSNRSSLEIISRSGFEVGYLMNVSACDECAGSGGYCGYNSNRVRTFACLCSNGGYAGRCPISASVQGSYMSLKTIAGLIFGIGVGGVFVAVMVLCYWKRRHSTTNSVIFWKRESKAQRVVNEFLKNYGSMAPKRYKYSDIKKITSSFKDKIGQGGYGGVFKGQLPVGRLVAVKLLNEAKGDGEDFINELASIIRTSHVNIVNLLGFCFDGPKRAVIYVFMANGSLEKFIYGSNSLEANSHLGCQTLYRIVVGVARGLEYLHRGCSTRILHFDIKPHNILLDQDFVPKISDFGLAKLCPGKESIILMLDARGTAGYIAPEVFNRNFGAVSHKSDVYSYGMMVLEIIGRRKNIDVGVDNASEVYFPDWIYKRLKQDKDLQLDGVISQEEEEITKKMILVGLWCIQTNPANRPGMSRVVEMLEGNHVILSIPPEPYLCFPAREQVSSSNT